MSNGERLIAAKKLDDFLDVSTIEGYGGEATNIFFQRLQAEGGQVIGWRDKFEVMTLHLLLRRRRANKAERECAA